MPDSRTTGDILERIVEQRRRDLLALGPTFGSPIPAVRERPLVPFLAVPGAILEIKRASPSKGDIAPDLDPAALAADYRRAGARNVSVLTERHFFRGSLDDLFLAEAAEPGLSYLRKDFLLSEEEIEVSYRAGADAVLLIARILDGELLCRMAALARSFGMRPFIEVREAIDLEKLAAAAAEGPVLSGVNARDLATFHIDPLIPAALRSFLPGEAVFESGIHSAGAAAYARNLGFEGILVGEAAARDPGRASSIVGGFLGSVPTASGQFWRTVAGRRRPARPLVKLCGFTRAADALRAAALGADLLGFVFAESRREASEAAVRETAGALPERAPLGRTSGSSARPLLVGVITETESGRARTALSLAEAGILDAIQYHGSDPEGFLCDPRYKAFGRYAALSLDASSGDPTALPELARLAALKAGGEPRVLVDAKVAGLGGGTGKRIPDALVAPLAASGGLWLAGGISVDNVEEILDRYSPELIDASSLLESEPGHKDAALVAQFLEKVDNHVR